MIERFIARIAWIAVLAGTLAPVAQAATVTKIEERALAPLRFAPKGAHVRLDAIPLADSARPIIELEEFSVWAPDGKVLLHTEHGVEAIAPPATRFFRGTVDGDPESLAFFAIKSNQRVEGLVVTHGTKYAIAANIRRGAKIDPRHRGEEPVDHFITEFDLADEMPNGEAPSWACDVDTAKLKAPREAAPAGSIQSDAVVVAQGISGTQTYEITMEIETDYDLYVNSGSNASALTDYVTNLSGAVSTIYHRDLRTNVVQKYLDIYTSNAADPWTSTSAYNGLLELGDKYHSAAIKPSGRRTSAVLLLSGVAVGSGIAWEGVIGGSDFAYGADFGGPYAWCGGIGNLGTFGLGTVPNPDGTVSGTLYGMPSGTQNYWPLAEYAHELGHNMGGHHTHCVAITDSERVAAGFTDGSAASASSNFIDHCYAQELQAGCYGGTSGSTSYVAGSQGTYKGTMMSYCHNVRVSNVPQSRFIFGVPSEPSHHELDDYMLSASGPGVDGGSKNIVNGVGSFTISAITAPASVAPGSTGNTASVSASPSTGATYAWTITNGTITSGAGTSSITFTAGASGTVVLKASAYNGQKVGVTDKRSVTINSVALPSVPTVITATGTSASSIAVSWTASANATSYEVQRSATKNGAFSAVGTTTGTSLTDTSVAANTAYVYKVRGINSAGPGSFSGTDAATAITFTDPVLTAGATRAKLLHFTELLTGVNALRKTAGLTPVTFSAPAPSTSVTIRAQHLTDLRAGLDQARSTLGLAALSYGALAAGATPLRTTDITTLRNGLQ